ncbi:hypothetical protein QJ48_23495 [Paenibacillus sp. A3]|uniref:acyltransferase family protein n=1 Tax=Paenibacillus sp. A3 TaxID=1337054 RepID=UPI0006D5AA24|nr:acyltransferase [Paenibacillus sp. A3]KPV57192.1 hypothetical protein QJ48_23495 [Paenibacillus sp. A3]
MGSLRFKQLDSLRGLAALTVLFHHLLLAMPQKNAFTTILEVTPARLFINGHGAVILFFLLSGFVLSLPVLNGNSPPYFSFLVKRLFRIYVPYLVTICITIYIAIVLYQGILPEFNSFINQSWKNASDPSLIAEHILFIGNPHTISYNPVIWTLIHELRISIIFPFIVLMVKNLNPLVSLSVCILLTFIAGLDGMLFKLPSNGYHSSYFDSLHYLSLFIIGSLIAKYRKQLMDMYLHSKASLKWTVLVAGLLFYNYSEVLNKYFFKKLFDTPYNFYLSEYGIAMGASVFIVASLASSRLSNGLTHSGFVFLGKISYSLYLTHLVVMLTLAHALHGRLSNSMILSLSFIGALMVAAVCWFMIERPSMQLGKYLTRNKQAASNQPTRPL